MTIGAHLVVLVAIQLILLMGLVGFAAFQDFRNARRVVGDTVATTARLAADSVAKALDEDRRNIGLIPAFAEQFPATAVCEFTSGQENWSDEALFRSRFRLLRPDGTSGCPIPAGEEGPAYGEAAWFQKALSSQEPIEVGPVSDPETGEQTYIFAVNIPRYDAVVATLVDLSSAGALLQGQFGALRPQPTFVLASKDRSVELGSTGNVGGRALDDTRFSRAIPRGSETFEDLGGVERIYGEAEVPRLGWNLYAGVSTSDALAAARRSLNERMLFAGVMILIVIAAAAFLSQRFVRPIRSLAKVTRKAAEGDLTAHVPPGGPAELKELGESFNAMLQIRKEAEAALKKAYRAERHAADELREVDAMRKAFLMAISHELRTPLTSVVGYSTFLNDAIDSLPEEEIRVSIEAISSQSKRLERLLLDLLDVERLERGIVEPRLSDTDVAQLVMRVVEQSSATRTIRADVKGPVMANVDPALVERMIENLVFNAIKHTPEGSRIWVRARRVNGHLRLSVEDSGEGVPDGLKDAIFEPFKQGEIKEHSPGTGIGLNLVSQFAKLHGGRAWVEDRKGGGAVFRVELPAKPQAKQRTTVKPKRRAA